jgi:hypothetical protein
MKLFGQSQQQGLSIVPLNYTSKTAERSLKSGCVKVKSFTTNAQFRRKRTPTARLKEL